MAEKEYIEREAVMQKFADHVRRSNNSDFAPVPTWNQAVQIVEDFPAADVRPVVKAAWYGEADGYADGELVYDMWSCPICGKRFEEWEEKPDWNYCPNCGADMREGSNEKA